MAQDVTDSAVVEGTTKTIHIGAQRYNILEIAAINLSAELGRRITAGQLAKFLIDNHLPGATQYISKHNVVLGKK